MIRTTPAEGRSEARRQMVRTLRVRIPPPFRGTLERGALVSLIAATLLAGGFSASAAAGYDEDSLVDLFAVSDEGDGSLPAAPYSATREAEFPGGSHLMNEGPFRAMPNQDARLVFPYRLVKRRDQDLDNPYDAERATPAPAKKSRIAERRAAERRSLIPPEMFLPPEVHTPPREILDVHPDDFPVRSILRPPDVNAKRKTGVNY